MGGTTALTLLANKVVPGLLDHYLGRTGYSSQQTDESRSSDRPSNLWQPVDEDPGEDFGAHGSFDERSHSRSPQVWASQHRGTVAALVGGGLGTVASIRRRRRGHRESS